MLGVGNYQRWFHGPAWSTTNLCRDPVLDGARSDGAGISFLIVHFPPLLDQVTGYCFACALLPRPSPTFATLCVVMAQDEPSLMRVWCVVSLGTLDGIEAHDDGSIVYIAERVGAKEQE